MPLLLLLLGGVIVVAVATSSSKRSAGGGGGGGGGVYNTITFTTNLPVERFEDARYKCTSTTAYVQGSTLAAGIPNPGYIPDSLKPGIPILTGYEYLSSVPRNPSARVAAMRSKIQKGPRGIKGTAPMVEASAASIYQLTTRIYNASTSKEGRQALANQLGVPVDAINQGIDGVMSAATKYGGTQGEALVREFSNYASEYVLKLLRELAMKIVAEMVSAAAASALASAIPIIGQVIEMFMKVAAAGAAIKAGVFKEQCEGWVGGLKKQIELLTNHGHPIPWHVFDVWSPACVAPREGMGGLGSAAEAWRPTVEQDAIFNTFDTLNKQWAKFTIAQVAPVTRWWTLATTYMSSDRVSRVFETMCIDSLGGTIASDEQVMVVAAPIAIAHGLDVDALATELYARSTGWIDSPFRQNTDLTTPRYKCEGGSFLGIPGIGARGCDIVGVEIVCRNTVVNCYVLNFVDLCERAFVVAEEMRTAGRGLYKEPVTIAAPMGGVASKLGSGSGIGMPLLVQTRGGR